MNTIKTICLSFTLIISFTIVNAQSENKDVIITASGSGKTLEDAKQSALRSATEQAFGAFISSKTEMFNDQVVADQMASVTSGNIKSFEILNQDQLPDGRWGVTLKTIVSIDKLTSFVQAKGVTIEVKGGMFAINIKQQLLNEQGEIKAVAQMVGLLHEQLQTSFDYVIKSSDPKSLDAESKNWEIPLVVTATCNKNIDFCANYFKKTISALSLTSAEVETYKSLNKHLSPVSFNYKGQNIIFYLRKQTSINLISSLLSNWDFYTRLFAVQSGMDEFFGKGQGRLFDIDGNNSYSHGTTISFPTAGNIAGTFTWIDTRTLSQIEQMTGYSVKPRGVISNFKNGGFVVWEKDGHGLVAALYDIGRNNWWDAKIACEELVMNGYSDWFLPTEDDLRTLYTNLYQSGFGGFARANYWSSTDNDDLYNAWNFDFSNGNAYKYGKDFEAYVRAVRAF
jgi:hypothetical protein